MNAINAVARLLASVQGRAIASADCYDIESDPGEIFAIVPMRVVGEEVIQAVGYGPLAQSPAIVVEYHALSRRTNFLRPFAKALHDYLKRMLDAGLCPRIYIPHPSALEVLTVMAARYESAGRNPNPNPTLRPKLLVVRLGYLCRLLKDIYHMPGQQIVVVMTEAMTRHFVTGQIPPKDGHLGALTEWIAAAPKTTDTQARSDAAALAFPAAAMLTRDQDNRVEYNLQRIKKIAPPQQRRLRQEIEAIQVAAVNSEWTMLQRAHAAFWDRHLRPSSHPEIVSENLAWLSTRFKRSIPRARRAIAMSQRYELHEYHESIHKVRMIANDNMRFAVERASGNTFIGSIVAVRKTPRGVQPKDHQIDLLVEAQPKIRLRVGRTVQLIGTGITGTVRSVNITPAGVNVTLTVVDGINSVRPGGPHRWGGAVQKFGNNYRYYEAIKGALGIQ